eukprot:4251091-Pyramimonas_sp.AAC.1
MMANAEGTTFLTNKRHNTGLTTSLSPPRAMHVLAAVRFTRQLMTAFTCVTTCLSSPPSLGQLTTAAPCVLGP